MTEMAPPRDSPPRALSWVLAWSETISPPDSVDSQLSPGGGAVDKRDFLSIFDVIVLPDFLLFLTLSR